MKTAMRRVPFLLLIVALAACQMTDQGGDEPEIGITKDGAEVPNWASGIDIAGAETGSFSDTVFTIENHGAGALYLTGTPTVELLGYHAHLFTVVEPFPAAQIPAGSSTTFTVRFMPTPDSGSGTRFASLGIRNTDLDEGEYQFEITAVAGKAPEMEVKQGSTLIPNGSGSCSFSTTVVGLDSDIVFTIQNLGTDTLNLTGSPDAVAFTGADAAQFTLQVPPPASIQAGNSATFTVRFSPQEGGIKNATATIANDDADEDPYDFAISGLGREAGSLDPAFGTGGIVKTDLGGTESCVAIAVQTDGKILAAGSHSTGLDQRMVLARYDASGNLDPGFGSGGVVMDTDGWPTCMLLLPDGRILVGGYFYNETDNDFRIARYTTTGALDASFGSGGVVTTPVGSSGDYCSAMALQPDGKIIAAGYAWAIYKRDFALVRYDPDGSLDSGFGNGGIAATDMGGEEFGRAVAVHPGGGILLAGEKNMDFIILRYTDNGSLDPGFGSGGVVTTDFRGGSDGARSICLQLDGRFIVSGYASGDFALARYLASGSLDASFGSYGKVTTDFGANKADSAAAAALQADGKILAAGGTEPSGGFYDAFALVRYSSAGVPDVEFGYLGRITTDLDSHIDTPIQALAIQADGRILAGGRSGNDMAVVRYRP